MRIKVFSVFVLAAVVLLTATLAQASVVTIYPQDFEGATVGQGLVANLGWTYGGTGTDDALVGSNLHDPGMTTKAADGDANYGVRPILYKALVIPVGATALDLTFNTYYWGNGDSTGSGFGFSGSPGLAGWSDMSFYNGYRDPGGVFLRLGAAETFSITYVTDEVTVNKIHIDLVNMTVTGSIEGSYLPGAKYFSTPQSISAVPTGLFYMSETRGGFQGLDIDDIVVTATLPGPVLDGTITLSNWNPWRVDRELIPVRVEIANLAGTVVFQQVVVLDSSNHYEIQLPGDFPDGDYNIYFSAAKWLREKVGPVTITQGLNTTASPTLINGDVDGDNNVNSTDLSAVLGDIDTAGK